MTLRALAAQRRRAMHRHRLAAAASHVGALTPDVAAALLDDDLPAPFPRPGDPLILAATDEAGSLWRVARPEDTDTVELGEHARAAWRVAARVAARALPIVADPAALTEAAPPRLARLTPPVDHDVFAVNGPSAGLAFALLHLSRAAGVPIAPDLACSAELAPDGALKPIDRLDRKLEAVHAWAPGVRRVLVAASQATLATPAGITLVHVRDLDAAWVLAFEEADFDAALRAAWASAPEAAAAAAAGFYRLVLREAPSALRWAAIARATHILVDHVSGEDRWRAEVAHAVAARHAGAPLSLPPLSPGARPRRPHRLQLLAHRLQAATDCADPAWEALVREAEDALPAPDDEHPEDLEVLGALGRLHGAWGRWAASVPPLRRAAHGWLELDREPDASRPICELLRVSGLTRDPTLAAEAEALARRCARDPRTSDHARAYLQLELGRAWALIDRPDAARAALSEGAVAWTEAAAHTRASRLRWQARLGDDTAFDALGELAARGADLALPFWLLSRADRGDLSALQELPPRFRALYDLGERAEPGATTARLLELFLY